MEPLDRSTIWPHEQGEVGDFYYQRFGSPTVAAAEAALGELDGGTALLFPSGAGATTALVLSLLEPGNTIALARGGYYGTGVAFGALESWGLRVVEFDQTGLPPDDVQLVWLEAPTNPYLTMPDLAAAAAHPAPVVVDATVATPVHLRPLEHGADFVLHSATKYLAGHDDALLGAVVCRDDAAAEELRTIRSSTGIIAAPDPAWLMLRGLKTLELRVRRQTESAGFLAERLRAHPAVETVRYPGLGGLLSFDVADAETARKVETSTRVIVNASSLGGVTSLIESRSRWEGDRVPPGLLRLSAGLEDPGDALGRPRAGVGLARGVPRRRGGYRFLWVTPPLRILVAEDDESFLEAISLLLEQDDRFVVAGRARNGREAVALAEEVAPDAVVVDIEMPVLDGVEATRRLREAAPDLPIVAVSGHDYEERVLEIRQAGADDYVRKARLADELPRVLAALLEAAGRSARSRS